MKRFFPDLVNIYGKDILTFSDNELLKFYDNPNNFYINDSDIVKNKKIFPDNVIITLTHGSYNLPNGCEKELIGFGNKDYYSHNMRLLKNFSDWGTTNIIDSMNLPEKQIVRTLYSRAIGDCNRAIDDNSQNGFLRKYDFGGIKLFKDVELLRKDGVQQHINFHNEISGKLQDIEQKGKKSFLFDVHDTGVLCMGNGPQKDSLNRALFPLISLADVSGSSCNHEAIMYLSDRINFYLGMKPAINVPFQGGYVTKRHGSDYRKKNNTTMRNAIQIELGRFLYMKESTQEIDDKKILLVGRGLKEAICDIGRTFK